MPLTAEQETLLGTAFRPHAPIKDPRSFVGRKKELDSVREVIRLEGLHVILFGERGCGKTSLANIATDQHERLQVFCEESASFETLLRDAAMQYQALHPDVITYDAIEDSISVRGLTLPVNGLTGNSFLRILDPGAPLCIIFDELDRVIDKSLVRALAELAKNAATYHSHLTLVMVGASETAEELLAGHLSNFRNLRQIPLTRMMNNELREIIAKGASILGISFPEEVIKRLIQICDRMPYYLHLLATNAAKSALERASNAVSLEDLAKATIAAANDVDHSLRNTYETAILSEKGSSIYRRLIWAIADLEDVSCNVGAINDKANVIAQSEGQLPASPQALGARLKTLRSEAKKCIIRQVMPGVYKFSHPLMKGFVRLIRFQQ